MKKIIVAGSRFFDDYDMLRKELDAYLIDEKLSVDNVEILSGNCRGADKLGERYAREHGIKIKYFIPDWKTYDKSAGPIRNKEMAEYAKDNGFLFLFWDGKSRGSKSMLYEASNRGIPYRLINYKEGVVFDGCGEVS